MKYYVHIACLIAAYAITVHSIPFSSLDDEIVTRSLYLEHSYDPFLFGRSGIYAEDDWLFQRDEDYATLNARGGFLSKPKPQNSGGSNNRPAPQKSLSTQGSFKSATSQPNSPKKSNALPKTNQPAAKVKDIQMTKVTKSPFENAKGPSSLAKHSNKNLGPVPPNKTPVHKISKSPFENAKGPPSLAKNSSPNLGPVPPQKSNSQEVRIDIPPSKSQKSNPAPAKKSTYFQKGVNLVKNNPIVATGGYALGTGMAAAGGTTNNVPLAVTGGLISGATAVAQNGHQVYNGLFGKEKGRNVRRGLDGVVEGAVGRLVKRRREGWGWNGFDDVLMARALGAAVGMEKALEKRGWVEMEMEAVDLY